MLDCNVTKAASRPSRNQQLDRHKQQAQAPANFQYVPIIYTFPQPSVAPVANKKHEKHHKPKPKKQKNKNKNHTEDSKKEKGHTKDVEHVYVDPPIVDKVSTVLEHVYNYFEDALTDKVIVKEPRAKGHNKSKHKKKQQHQHEHGHHEQEVYHVQYVPQSHDHMQHGHMGHGHMGHGHTKNQKNKNQVGYQYVLATSAPYGHYTQGYKDQVPQISTQMHITTDYIGQRPTSVKPSVNSGSESDEYADPEDEFTDSEVSWWHSMN